MLILLSLSRFEISVFEVLLQSARRYQPVSTILVCSRIFTKVIIAVAEVSEK